MEFFPISTQLRIAFHALSLEAAPVRAPGWQVLEPGSALREEDLGGPSLLRFPTGVGEKQALRRLASLPDWSFEAALLGGFAGALDRTLEPGTVVVADPIIDSAGGVYEVPLASEIERDAQRVGLTVRRGPLVSVDRVVGDPASKRALAEETGACAVDMESVALAGFLANRGIPFGVGRIVLDRAGEALPPTASVASALGQLVRREGWQRLVGFLRVGMRVPRCARAGSRLIESWLRGAAS